MFTQYGQEHCLDAAVIEITKSALKDSSKVVVSDYWAPGLDQNASPCSGRSANLRVFVQDAKGKERWNLFEELEMLGRQEERRCEFSVHGRTTARPDGISDADGYEWVHVPTDGIERIRLVITATDDRGRLLPLFYAFGGAD